MIKLPDALQEIFDIVSTHLLKQVKRSVASFGVRKEILCAYRGKNGMKCAAGILIPDDQYKSEMECVVWEELAEKNYVENKFVKEIADLQEIHDGNRAESTDYLKTQLIRFAEKHNLQVNFES